MKTTDTHGPAAESLDFLDYGQDEDFEQDETPATATTTITQS